MRRQWRDLHERFGALPFADLFTDAIGYAEHGYPVSRTVARHWQRAGTTHASLRGPEFTAWADVFAPDGRTPAPGKRFRGPFGVMGGHMQPQGTKPSCSTTARSWETGRSSGAPTPVRGRIRAANGRLRGRVLTRPPNIHRKWSPLHPFVRA